jgi:hypothetical protein
VPRENLLGDPGIDTKQGFAGELIVARRLLGKTSAERK